MLKIKIGIFCEKWETGGIESFLVNVLENINWDRSTVTIIIAEIASNFYMQRLQKCCGNIIELSGNLHRLHQNHSEFRKLLEREKFDVIHFNIYHALSMWYTIEAKNIGVSCRIVHSHNSCLRNSKAKFLKLAIHNICKQIWSDSATELWACSLQAAKFMFPHKKIHESQVAFVPNGISLQRFAMNKTQRQKIRNQLGVKNCFVIGNVGRLCPQKNQSFLLDVFAKVEHINPASRLLLIGEGNDEAALRKKAERLKILNKVFFVKPVKEIEQLYWAMDVFIFPSVFEGLGIVAIEAQVSGLPVVCSDKVPEEAIVTELARQIPLDAGCDVWAEHILSLRNAERQDQMDELYAEGYEIRDVAQRIGEVYCQGSGSELLFRPVGGKMIWENISEPMDSVEKRISH